MAKEKLSLWERFRGWAWTQPNKHKDEVSFGDYQHANVKYRLRNSRLAKRRERNRARNRTQKLSRRINWGLK